MCSIYLKASHIQGQTIIFLHSLLIKFPYPYKFSFYCAFCIARKLYALFLRSLVSYKISEDISIILFQSLQYNQMIDYLLHAKTCFLHKKKNIVYDPIQRTNIPATIFK